MGVHEVFIVTPVHFMGVCGTTLATASGKGIVALLCKAISFWMWLAMS
jgi:hypothetical protein